jgi:hypothetical protein
MTARVCAMGLGGVWAGPGLGLGQTAARLTRVSSSSSSSSSNLRTTSVQRTRTSVRPLGPMNLDTRVSLRAHARGRSLEESGIWPRTEIGR